jgi:hypothetical protein
MLHSRKEEPLITKQETTHLSGMVRFWVSLSSASWQQLVGRWPFLALCPASWHFRRLPLCTCGRQAGAGPTWEVEDGPWAPGLPSRSVVAFGCAARI